jgi:hypothetical protein
MVKIIVGVVAVVLLIPVVWFIVRLAIGSTGRFQLPEVDDTPDSPSMFGYKISWLAVPSEDIERVFRVLEQADARFDGRELRRCNWRSGLARIFANFRNPEVFISPPVDGWILVANWQPSDETSLDSFKPILERLSAEFGRAFLFGSHRVVSFVMWAVAEDGELKRGLVESDGTTYVDVGERLSAEEDLGLLSYDELDELLETAADQGDEDALYSRLADERTVLDLAALWSIDPSTLDERNDEGVGRIVRPKR